MDFVLGPPVFFQNGGAKVRLADDARKCVVFLGQQAIDNNNALDPDRTATGFFLFSDLDGVGTWYLVTNKHVALGPAEAPFFVRFNEQGTENSFLHKIEDADWAFHDDKTVDLAVLEFRPPPNTDTLAFDAKHILDPPRTEAKKIGPGDITYVVGLFKRLPGTNRCLPIVHTGHLALLNEGNERVRSFDWDNPLDKTAKKLIKAHLVQAHTLSGSSGSPVFIKRGIATFPVEETGVWPKAYGAVFLLGVWQGSFEALPDEILALEIGRKDDRVGVGIGNVVPAHQVREILLGKKLAKARAEAARKKLATQDATTLDLKLHVATLGDVNKVETSTKPIDIEAFKRFVESLPKSRKNEES